MVETEGNSCCEEVQGGESVDAPPCHFSVKRSKETCSEYLKQTEKQGKQAVIIVSITQRCCSFWFLVLIVL